MNFNSENSNIKGLLTNPRSYVIPRFQRDYSWEKRHYSEFLNDMLEQLSFIADKDKFEVSPYYLGNMLFLGDNSLDSVDVIDGQQRLTTITILLAAIRNHLFKLYEKDNELYSSAKEYANTIQNEYLVKKIDGQPSRKVQTYSSYPYFTQTIQDYHTANNSVNPNTQEEVLLKATFDYFVQKLDAANLISAFNKIKNEKVSEKNYLNLLIALRDQVLSSEIISIFSSDKSHIHRIFQNINSKGKPLSQVDLIKNDLFSKINVTEAGVDEMSRTWAKMLNILSELDVSADEFFFHFWKANYPKDRVMTTTLYEKYIRKYNRATQKQLVEFVSLLEKSLSNYEKIVSPDFGVYKKQKDIPKGEALDIIKNFHGIQIRIVLLSLYNSGFNIPTKEEVDFLLFLADFHFIVFGIDMNIRTNKLSKPYMNFVTNSNKAESLGSIRKAMVDLKNDLFSLVKESDFIAAFIKLSYSKKSSFKDNYAARYAIRRISNILDDRSYSPNESSVEHIIDESGGVKYSNIGNLITIETSLNNKVNFSKQKYDGYIDYEQKKSIYKKSKYKIVSNFLAKYDIFQDKYIEERAKCLANIFWKNFKELSEISKC